MRSVITTEKAGLHFFEYANSAFNQLELVDTTLSNASSTILLPGTHLQIAGGKGNETVHFTATTLTKPVNLGGGEDKFEFAKGFAIEGAVIDGGEGKDTLSIHAVDAENLANDGSFAGAVKNFEALLVQIDDGDSIRTVDMAKFGPAIKDVELSFNTSDHATVKMENFFSGSTVKIGLGQHSINISNPRFASGSNDIVQSGFDHLSNAENRRIYLNGCRNGDGKRGKFGALG